MRKLFENESGSIAIMSAVSATVVAGVVGVAILFNQGTWAHEQLQGSLDAAVLAATALPASASKNERINIAAITFDLNMQKSGLAHSADFNVTVAPKFVIEKTQVSALTKGTVANGFGAVIGITDLIVVASATAVKTLSEPVCVLALNEKQPASIEAYGTAKFNAQCAVQANSNHGAGLKIYGNATAMAAAFGVTGGYSGSAWSPQPVEGTSVIMDPYASLPVPTAGPCMSVDKFIKTDVTLEPGTYCGGINVKTGAHITLNPGVYIMKDGQFAVNSGSSVNGKDVMIALVGTDSYLSLLSQSATMLTSPRNGIYKNIQFMSDRDLSTSQHNKEWTTILGGATLDFDGVMYLPEQQIWASGAGGKVIINANSPTMAIVADKIWAQGNVVYEITNDDRRNMDMAHNISFEYGARLVK
jgi:Putative Flp pilus-assembly TadE/G-like